MWHATVFVIVFLIGFTLAVILGSFFEFAVHWFLHYNKRLWRWHAMHHIKDTSWWWPLEALFIYLPMASPFLLLTPWLGWGWFAGACFYCCLLPWSHNLAHRNMTVPLMSRHVHVMHHAIGGRRNYGIVTDIWDRLFGTYRLPAITSHRNKKS